MKREELIEKLAEVIDVDTNELTLDTIFQEMENWDSLAIIGIMALFNEEFGIYLKAKQIMECKTISNLIEFAGDKVTI